MGDLEDKVSSVERNSLLKKVLNGNFECKEELIKNNILLDGQSYVVLVLRIDSFKRRPQNLEMNEMVEHRNSLISIANEYISKEFKIETVEDGLEFIPIVANIPNNRINWLNDLKEIIKDMQKEFLRDCHLTFNTGIGNIVFSIKELRHSFLDAIEVTNYRIIYGNSKSLGKQLQIIRQGIISVFQSRVLK